MTWKFEPAGSAFQDFHREWDALNHRRTGHILLDSTFVTIALRNFGNGHVLLAFNDDVARGGMALVVKKKTGVWETFQPAQAPIGLILLGYTDESGEGLQQLTRKLPGYALQFSALQQDPECSSFPPTLGNCAIETMEYISTARITVRGSFDDYWKTRGSNLRHNLSRRRRRMAEKGYALELAERRSSGEVANAIIEYGRLEETGWKGREGTAVSDNNDQGRFYRDLFEACCDRGEAVIYQLLLNGKVVASDLCLIRDGMMVVLKTAYDESLNEFSPALLMREEIMKVLFKDPQMRVVEFYGRVMEWHTRWTDEIRALYHVNCPRSPWVRTVREVAKRFA
jgi:GNAT acetyltransferase-like protein